MPRTPEEPAPDECTRHEVTHLPYQPFCAWCVMGKGRAKPHQTTKQPTSSMSSGEMRAQQNFLTRTKEDVNSSGFEVLTTVEFCETTEGVDERTVRAILAGKKKELDTYRCED